ncbi:hypothetical protein KR032_009724 [Drosophila birchii]|nr:hypothetical protein KR032_009724 [Drosophila birchii]
MLQRSALPGQPRRPIHQEVRQLSDAQLSIMCQSHRIFPGPITFRNRRQAERQLHIALIGERAKFRAQQQFAEECRLQYSEDPNYRPGPPPPQQHYDFRADLAQSEAPSPHFWPKPRTVNMRFNPVPSSGIQFRQEPILEHRQYVSWQQQNRVHQQQAQQQNRVHQQQAQQQSFHQLAKDNVNFNAGDSEINFLGFKLPFSLETAREITTKIGEIFKRFQGVGENQAATRFEGGSVKQKQGKYETPFYDEQSESDVVVPHQKHQSLYQASAKDDESEEEEYQADEFEMEDLKIPHEDFNYPCCDRDTLCDQWELQTCAPPLPFEYREAKPLADDQAQTDNGEHSSCASMATIYHDFFSQQPPKRAAEHFWWWWWPQRESAGDERIPEAEQTRETEHKHEHEVKSIHYLNDSALHVDDGVMELMQRVELRDDSEEEDLVVLSDGTLSTRPMPRTYVGFCRTIFRSLLCDQDSKLDPAKLRRAFLGCCLAFAIYMGIRMIR